MLKFRCTVSPSLLLSSCIICRSSADLQVAVDLKKNAKEQLERQSNKFVSSRKSGGRKKHVEYNLATKAHMVGAYV